MQKWIVATLLTFIVPISAYEESATNTGFLARSHCHKPGNPGKAGDQGPDGGGFGRFASYWLTNQPSLSNGQKVLFNLQQTLKGIEYDETTGIFTMPAGVYAINFFGTPSTLNLNVNGLIIPTPSLEGSMVVVQFTSNNNQVAVQATGDWTPQTSGIGSYFFAYASIAIYQIGTEVL